MRRMTALLVGLALVGAVAAGCSSSAGSSNDSGNGPTISKAEFLKKGNKLCKSVMDKFNSDAESEGLDSASTSKQTDFVKNKLVPAYEKLLSQLRALGYPKGDKAKLDKIYGQAEKTVAKYKKNPEAALTANGSSAEEKGFRDYGLTDCAGDSSDTGSNSASANS